MRNSQRSQQLILLIVLSILSLCLCQNCDTFKTKQDCTQNNSCQWSSNGVYTCDLKVNCSQINDEKECEGKGDACSWKQPTEPTCQIKKDACALNNDSSACNYPDSCNFTAGKDATCQSKDSFDCQSITADECPQKPYCNIVTNYSCVVSNYCSTLSYNDCVADSQNCSGEIKTCKPSPNAQKTCQLKKERAACEEIGCEFKSLKCQAPQACTLQQDNTCLQACTVDTFTCSSAVDQCTGKESEAACPKNYCDWKGTNACADNKNYCQLDNCQESPDQCTYIPKVDPTCSNNTKDNQCIKQQSKENCTGLGYCDYTQPTNQCQSNYVCSIFEGEMCQIYPFCSYNTEYVCTINGNNTYGYLLHSVLIALFAIFLY